MKSLLRGFLYGINNLLSRLEKLASPKTDYLQEENRLKMMERGEERGGGGGQEPVLLIRSRSCSLLFPGSVPDSDPKPGLFYFKMAHFIFYCIIIIFIIMLYRYYF